METLRENAKLLAQRARLFKHDVELSPMSSYERLVVHELFAEDAEIETLQKVRVDAPHRIEIPSHCGNTPK